LTVPFNILPSNYFVSFELSKSGVNAYQQLNFVSPSFLKFRIFDEEVLNFILVLPHMTGLRTPLLGIMKVEEC
jgi:hypothetical protein